MGYWKTPEEKGLTSEEIKEICERLWLEAQSNLHICNDCGANVGEQHFENCDVARCSICGGQLLSCGCYGEPDYWTGIWPGYKECYERKLICQNNVTGEWLFDLNTLAASE